MYGIYLIDPHQNGALFHIAMAVVLIAVGSVAFVRGYWDHGKILPLILASIGTALLIYGAQTPVHLNHTHGLTTHLPTVVGSVVLIAGHFFNWKSKGKTC